MVLVSKANKRKIYEYVLREGVIVIRKDWGLDKHAGTDVPNLQVFMVLRSLESRGFVTCVFNWQHFYYTIAYDESNKAIKFLRDELGIMEDVVPNTYKTTKKTYLGKGEAEEGEDRPRRRGGFRGGRRGGPRGGYRGGFGRGRREGEEPEQQPQAEEDKQVQEENY